MTDREHGGLRDRLSMMAEQFRVGISNFFVNPENLGIRIWRKKSVNYGFVGFAFSNYAEDQYSNWV